MATFANRFKELRINSNLTQEEIANKFSLGKSSISKYESGKQVPETAMLETFASFFGVSIDYLLGRSDDKVNKIVKYETKESFIIDLLNLLVKQGKIKDVNNISEETMNMIINAIKMEAQKIIEADN